jgi:opacity protein-like surface antigen
MKKLLTVTLLVFSMTATLSLNAQKGFSVSVKGTPQFTWMNNSDDNDNNSYDSKSKFAANFGVGTQYNFNRNIGVGLDVLYSLQGRKYDLDGGEYDQKNDYIKIPVFFSYNTDPAKKIAFVGKLGPQLSILTNSKLDGGNFAKADTKAQYEDISFGAMANAGVQFAIAKNIYLNTGVRFDYDFTNAEDDSYPSYPTGRAKTYNSSLGLEVGLKYQLR